MTPGAATNRDGKARSKPLAPRPEVRRCAVYCRKSVEERHATDFGSVDAQREAGAAYIKTRADRGWTPVETRYEDEGFTGANTERPGLQRLLADIEAHLVDVVVVYKVDRLSRSLPDFARLMETFDRLGVAFVSVTQEIDTTTSMGRMALNILFTFAQFEREMISERTRDKMRAARRKGKFTGGTLLLGFDRHVDGGRLVVNDAEAERVREIFNVYLTLKCVRDVAVEMASRGWTTKAWTTKSGRVRTGRPMTAVYLAMLLRNPAYVGRVRVGDETVPAEHPAIVERSVFDAAQALLTENAASGGRLAQRRSDALLCGLLRCAACDRAMTPTGTTKRGRRYSYYVCRKTRETGWASCPAPSVAAGEIERLVVEQIRGVGADRGVQARVLAAVRAQTTGGAVDEADLRRVLGLWDEVWEALLPTEQVRLMRLLVERVAYDGRAGTVAVTFHPTGIAALAAELPA